MGKIKNILRRELKKKEIKFGIFGNLKNGWNFEKLFKKTKFENRILKN